MDIAANNRRTAGVIGVRRKSLAATAAAGAEPNPGAKASRWGALKKRFVHSDVDDSAEPLVGKRFSEAVGDCMRASTGLKKNLQGKKNDDDQAPVARVSIPSWSVEDRAPRVRVEAEATWETKMAPEGIQGRRK